MMFGDKHKFSILSPSICYLQKKFWYIPFKCDVVNGGMMMSNKIPILDFDPSKDAIISPRKIARTTAKCAVLSFFWEAVGEYANANRCEHLSSFTSEMPDIPLYLHKENNFLLVPMPVGAPLAAAV